MTEPTAELIETILYALGVLAGAAAVIMQCAP